MIVTLTANPSLDRTAHLRGPLERGGVNRIEHVTVEPGGKGVNVARAVALAGESAVAVLPARGDDPLLAGLDRVGLAYRNLTVAELARTNLTVTEPDGTTTKLNEPGAALTGAEVDALATLLLDVADGAGWVALSGSLPPGVPPGWYARLVAELHARGVRVAVDTSDAPLCELAAAFPAAAPDLLKPNAEELGQLTGADGALLEAAAQSGDLAPTVVAAGALVARGVGAVLATLGAAGALLVTAEGAWSAAPPPITPRSTVGAGDSSLAGYLLAAVAGGPEPDRLRRAVAYGSAAASLPGTALPRPEQTDPDRVVVTRVR
ncbi:1-phosphofructokinase family hexose kinase [Georgenia muralis]|uniref:1-phosphofructokinase n=1 Tax=Georgenia muralis TaxID=154117 RepID=A0A3N4Z633_9MICO|nr:1-phosphofructokinase family hexose kinase [Georgenia muralis]RPF27256.1 1-phosphofructokinase [Georgenia muralis]